MIREIGSQRTVVHLLHALIASTVKGANKLWIERLIDRYGRRVEFIEDEKLEERGFDLCK